ncbi:MAG TPA: hypothetical protein VGA04_09440 [Streptosporangiaceae bacterium]
MPARPQLVPARPRLAPARPWLVPVRRRLAAVLARPRLAPLRLRLPGRLRLAAVLAAGAAGLLLTASCASSNAPGATPSATPSATSTGSGVAGNGGTAQQLRAFEPALVQCFASHGLIPKSALAGQSWYHAGRVTADNSFYIWWTENDAIKAGGKELVEWLSGAINNGSWPAICGPMPSPASS